MEGNGRRWKEHFSSEKRPDTGLQNKRRKRGPNKYLLPAQIILVLKLYHQRATSIKKSSARGGQMRETVSPMPFFSQYDSANITEEISLSWVPLSRPVSQAIGDASIYKQTNVAPNHEKSQH